MADFHSRKRDDRPQEEKIFEEVVINIDRVARVVKGGRRFRFKALVVVGDGKKRVGIGVSKGADVQTAVTKAASVAKKNIVELTIYKDTLPHEAEAKIGGARVLLKPAAPGTGIIAGGTVRSILNVTGIKNVLSKSLGSSNKVNIAYATLSALEQMVAQKDWVTSELETAKKTDKAEKTKAKKVAKKPATKAKEAKKEEKK